MSICGQMVYHRHRIREKDLTKYDLCRRCFKNSKHVKPKKCTSEEVAQAKARLLDTVRALQ